MRQDNAFTTPEQRFFLPVKLEAEHHESFDMADKPAVNIMDGQVSYAVIDNPGGKEVAYVAEDSPNILSGSKIKRIVGVNTDNRLSFIDPANEDDEEGTADAVFNNPVDSYELKEGDLLVLMVDRTYFPEDSPLRDEANQDGIILVPADEELPYLDYEKSESATFSLMGVVTAEEEKLLTWPSGRGRAMQDVVDLCVINANVQNKLELRLLLDRLEMLGSGSGSLLELMRINPAAQAYLEYMDNRNGTNYLPAKEPSSRVGEFGKITLGQLTRYTLIEDATYVSAKPRTEPKD